MHYPHKTRVQLLPASETPAARLAFDPLACTTQELLAALIGGVKQLEIAQALIEKYGNLTRILKAHPNDLELLPDIGFQTAIRIKAALVLGQRMVTQAASDEQTAINSPADAAMLVQNEMSTLDHEELWVLNLDRRNRVIEITHLYKGSVSSSQVRVGEVFQAAIRLRASAIIPVHNHPSSDPTPSPDDVALTRAVVQAGKLLDCDVLDHLVIGSSNRWVSLKERGLGFA
jgi:DNA repair protein RadC